jgi:hypothetical protein
MDVDGTINLLILALGIATTGAVGFAIAWVRARERALRAERPAGERALPEKAAAQRVEQLERALESMAQDLERLNEGQRFTTDLLSGRAEREGAPPPPLPPRPDGSR